MSGPIPPKGLPPPESFEVPPAYTDEPPTDTTPQVEINQEVHLAVETGELNVESPMQKICKIMCVTTNSALMVLAWTMASMYFSTLSEYWLLAALPFFHYYEYLIAYIYPASAVMVVVLLLSPVFAFAGDVRYGNFRLLVSGVIPLNVFGLIVLVVVAVAAAIVGKAFISYFLLIGYLLVLLAGGIFQANAIQFGRDVLGDWNSPERSAFVHWYYWATYMPTFAVAVILGIGVAIDGVTLYIIYLLPIAVIAVLIFLLVTCIVNCVHLKSRGQITVLPRLTGNPVKQVLRVTRYALRSPARPGQHGLLARLNKSRMRNGGPADDDEVDNVASFWLLVLLMVSLYGFLFWDDMWAMPFANSVIDGSTSILWVLSSQLTTSVVVFIGVPIYQLVIRPLLGKHSPPLLWRILAGLILLLISLVVVTWSGAATMAHLGSEVLSDVCNFNLSNDEFLNGTQAGEGVGWFVLAIPQGINGIGQLLVFPAVIELILTDAPRVMQGLLIGVWYAMQSIHVLVGIIETATCAVYYWQYYILKIVLVLMSTISFGIIALFYKRNRAVLNGHVIRAQGEVITYQPLQEVSNVDSL